MPSKDYAAWHTNKTELNNLDRGQYFYEREVWWIAIGNNIGDEQDGKGTDYTRPIIILRKFNHHLFWGIPLTTTGRSGRYYVSFRYKPGLISTAILSQLRAFDTKRLLKRDGQIDEVDYARIVLGLVLILRKEP